MPENKAIKKESKVTKESSESKVKSQKTEGKRQEPEAGKQKLENQLTVPVFTIKGEEAGTLPLSAEIFGVKVNKALLAQAARVYTNNQLGHFSNTKTRGEVEGSTRKIFKQKGTGRARHGAVRAPIFVGGGIALGPKARKISLNLPQKMKKAALFSALSAKLQEKAIFGVEDLDKASGKTKEMASFLKKVGKKSALFISYKPSNEVKRALRNIPRVSLFNVSDMNAYEVIKHASVFLTKEAAGKLQGGKNA